MNDMLTFAIERSIKCNVVFAKFLSPNDTGLTGGHQCGIYIPKPSVSLIFDALFDRGENHDRWVDIVWNEKQHTTSRFIYYGQGTRNEYRITNFGRGFDLLKPDHTGDLLILCKESEDLYYAYTLSNDEDIQAYLDSFSLSPTRLNQLIKEKNSPQQPQEDDIFDTYLTDFGGEFPNTKIMSLSAEEVDLLLHGETITLSPDETIVRWIDTEYKLFRHIEESYYGYVTLEPAESLDSFVRTGLEITNRRKSRAGKSLEHHLAAIFDKFGIQYAAQAVTEMNKKPDFIFPSQEAYDNANFPTNLLTFLGAKTTCKDRWRQVINEANRIEKKYLFTLQQGVSPNQLREMQDENLVLVVPKEYHKFYPTATTDVLISLQDFIDLVMEKQHRIAGQ